LGAGCRSVKRHGSVLCRKVAGGYSSGRGHFRGGQLAKGRGSKRQQMRQRGSNEAVKKQVEEAERRVGRCMVGQQ